MKPFTICSTLWVSNLMTPCLEWHLREASQTPIWHTDVEDETRMSGVMGWLTICQRVEKNSGWTVYSFWFWLEQEKLLSNLPNMAITPNTTTTPNTTIFPGCPAFSCQAQLDSDCPQVSGRKVIGSFGSIGEELSTDPACSPAWPVSHTIFWQRPGQEKGFSFTDE